MGEINLNWPMDFPPEWTGAIRKHVEENARQRIESIVGPGEMGALTILVTGSGPGEMKLNVQGPPWLLRAIKSGFAS